MKSSGSRRESMEKPPAPSGSAGRLNLGNRTGYVGSSARPGGSVRQVPGPKAACAIDTAIPRDSSQDLDHSGSSLYFTFLPIFPWYLCSRSQQMLPGTRQPPPPYYFFSSLLLFYFILFEDLTLSPLKE